MLYPEPEPSCIFSPCKLYRYTLERDLQGKSGKVAVWTMLNPSTADELQDDPTIRRVRSFCEREGCSKLIVTNAYAFRATDPKMLAEVKDPEGPDNLRICLDLIQKCDLHVVAWGASLPSRPSQLRRSLWVMKYPSMCLGVTKTGHPRHPLYVPSNQPLVPYDWGSHAAA